MNHNNIIPPWERKQTEFNEILRQLRIRTSEQLAEAIGVHKITAQKYMRGGYSKRDLMAIRGMLLAKRVKQLKGAADALVKYHGGETHADT